MNNSSVQLTKFDLIVIGAGSGGLSAAEFAIALGATVALVEADERLGGECLHAGCVPSKAFIHAARRFQTVRDHLEPWDDLRRDSFSKAMLAVQASINQVEADHDNRQYYEDKGVKVFIGRAAFTNHDTVSIAGSELLQGKRFIVATGSRPLIPGIPGLSDINYLTNENFFEQTALPASLIVIGGGPIGCELGQAMAMFGVQVTIISQDERLLPRDEPEASAALQASLEKMSNVKLIFQAKITSVSGKDGSTVNYDVGEKSLSVSAERVLVATGRAANTELGLEKAGIDYTDRLIVTSDTMQTSNKIVYAIGDVMGGPNFTHVAVDQAVAAVQNALLGRKKAKRDLAELPWATFTYPEIAHLGADEASLIKSKIKFETHVLNLAAVDKAVADQESGQVKVMVDDKGLILGATVIGGPASEIIGQLALAKHEKLKLVDLGGTLQAYPTYAFGLKLFANGLSLKKFEAGPQKKFATLLRKFTLR